MIYCRLVVPMHITSFSLHEPTHEPLRCHLVALTDLRRKHSRCGCDSGSVQTMLAKEQVAWTFQRLRVMTMPPVGRWEHVLASRRVCAAR